MSRYSKNEYLKLIRDYNLRALYLYFDPIYQNFLEASPRNEGDIVMETKKAGCILDIMVKLDQDKRRYEKELIEFMVTENPRFYSNVTIKDDK